jgi:hypothetical protein
MGADDPATTERVNEARVCPPSGARLVFLVGKLRSESSRVQLSRMHNGAHCVRCKMPSLAIAVKQANKTSVATS